MPRRGETTDPVVRFWAKVDQSQDCWIWIGATHGGGYGSFNADGRRSGERKTVQAHVFSYELAYGPVPKGWHVHHKCVTPSCVRPEHLVALTPREHCLVNPKHPINQTHCYRGHELAGDNLRLEGPLGRRRCETCRRERVRRRRQEARLKDRSSQPQANCSAGSQGTVTGFECPVSSQGPQTGATCALRYSSLEAA